MTSNDTAAIPEPTTSPEPTANPQTPNGTGKSDTAEQIRHHALTAFAEGGYGGTSLRQISTAVGCDVALIPYYFGNKSKLFISVVGDASRATRATVLEGFQRTVADGDNPAEAMENVYGFLNAWTQGEGQLGMRALLMTAAAGGAVPAMVQRFAMKELQALISEITDFEGFWPETRFGLTTFVGLVIGTEILTHFVDYKPLAELGREDLARLQVGALLETLEMLWADAEPPDPAA